MLEREGGARVDDFDLRQLNRNSRSTSFGLARELISPQSMFSPLQARDSRVLAEKSPLNHPNDCFLVITSTETAVIRNG
jgi:hypothetical protein